MIKSIQDFLESNQYMTVACVDEARHPYCFNCFYFFDSDRRILVFTSSPQGTKHVPLLYVNHIVSGSVLPDSMPEGVIQGIQFSGSIIQPVNLGKDLGEQYMQKYPVARSMPHVVWGIDLLYVKFTDNSVRFGYKEIWKK